MLNALMETANTAYTENSAATLRTSGSACLDLFATIGALRNAGERDICRRFIRAWAEDRDTAMKILFYGRDVRGGLGERRMFRIILRKLAHLAPDTLRKNLCLVPEFGRWDDIMVLLDTPFADDVAALVRSQLAADLAAMEAGTGISLMAKWLPSVNASNPVVVRQAKRLAKALDMNDARYRRTVVKLRAQLRLLENNLRERDYTFDYAKQPSKAMFKYRRAFLRNDGDRYAEFMEQVAAGAENLHTGSLMPYDIVHRALCCDGAEAERLSLDATWHALEDFTQGENALCVVDGSGSMYSGERMRPIEVALSLGIYFAEHNTGAFHDYFITFSHSPRLVKIEGTDIVDKVVYCAQYNEVADTNLQRVFELVLKAAVDHAVPQQELPSTLYIITDMEFNSCTQDAEMTNFAYARSLFAAQGYQLPGVVFWNVDSRSEQQPVSMNEQSVALVSGTSARVFQMVASKSLDPYRYMMEALARERYADITA